MMADLSAAVRVGALRIEGSLVSFLKTSARVLRALEVGSRLEDLAAAVYWCERGLMLASFFFLNSFSMLLRYPPPPLPMATPSQSMPIGNRSIIPKH